MNSYNKYFIVNLDNDTTIKEVITNSFLDIRLRRGSSIITVLSSQCHTTLFNEIKNLRNNISTNGIRCTLINNESAVLFLTNLSDKISAVCVSVDSGIIEIFDEMIRINNEQMRMIRDFYTKINTFTTENEFFEEIMQLNNSLINTRRELSQKNKKLEVLNNQLELINYTDYLTKIPNRRKFFVDVYRLIKEKEHLLVMMDFNNFKTINDKYGHKRGDEALIYFADKMTELIKPIKGELYRLGGDEFAFITPVLNPNIDNIFSEINKGLHQFDDLVSMSYGLVPLNSKTVNENNKVELKMHQADKMMYNMKQEYYKKLKE